MNFTRLLPLFFIFTMPAFAQLVSPVVDVNIEPVIKIESVQQSDFYKAALSLVEKNEEVVCGDLVNSNNVGSGIRSWNKSELQNVCYNVDKNKKVTVTLKYKLKKLVNGKVVPFLSETNILSE